MNDSLRNRTARAIIRLALIGIISGMWLMVALPSLAIDTKTSTDKTKTTKTAEESKTTTAALKPALTIDIPTVTFSDVKSTQGDFGMKYSLPWIAEYLTGVYEYAIGIGAFLAGVMILIGGFIYLTSADSGRTGQAKSMIIDSLLGLAIMLGSYVLLNTINPNLTIMGAVDVYLVEEEEFEGIEFISSETYTAAVGGPPPSASQNIAAARQVAQENNIDPCLFEAVVLGESGGRADAIGHDENVPRSGVGSRRQFISDGRTYLATKNAGGSTWQPPGQGTAEYDRMIGDRRVRNDDGFNPSAPPNFGLDTRYTHGFGLAQVTGGLSSTPWQQCNGQLGFSTLINSCTPVLDLLRPEVALIQSARLMQAKARSCPGGLSNYRCIFYRWAGSGCSARVSICHKAHKYAQCKGDPSLAAMELPYSRCREWTRISDRSRCADLNYHLQ